MIVQKYGGSSLSSPARIREIAGRIARRARENTRLVVAVSAMGQTTDDLLQLAYEITSHPPQRELDMLLTVGERISMALLSMALNSEGCPAISFTGSQSGIVTDVSHTRALIEDIRPQRIRAELSKGKVVIVAGFQGVSHEREITTLGRGGSDTTAVAVAAALGAAQCEMYSDYPGVFSADPKWIPSAHVIPHIGYDELLELAARGARVIHYRAAEIARRYKVRLKLLSSFDGTSLGTLVDDNVPMENAKVTSITCNPSVALIRLRATRTGRTLAGLLEQFGRSELQIINYYKESSTDGVTVSIVVDRSDVQSLNEITDQFHGERLRIDKQDDLASVSVIGSGFSCNSSTVLDIERLLAKSKVPVSCVMTSSLSVTCLIPEAACKEAVDILHSSLFNKSHE
ncbi:MAG: aspartate kinase [Candidatus Krumholzibacteria bacterium]|nr:aspartate kinase [Candidatus Krumholzibacteria bacterium]